MSLPTSADLSEIVVDYQRVAQLLADRFGPIQGPLELERATWQAAAEELARQRTETAGQLREMQQKVDAWTAAEASSAPAPIGATRD